MLHHRVLKPPHNALQRLHPILPRPLPHLIRIHPQRFQPIMKLPMLLPRMAQQAGLTSERFDEGKHAGFFGVVVVVDHFCPGGGEEEEVGHFGGVVARCRRIGDARDLEDEGVEAAEEAVVGVGHFGGEVEGGVVGLGG